MSQGNWTLGTSLRAAAAAGLLVAGTTATTAGTIRHDVDESVYRAIGDLPLFESVGRLSIGSDDGNFSCSGTLIADRWAMTAAHCVDFATTIDFTVGGDTYNADNWVHHPNWLPDNFFQLLVGNDIGLIHLSEPVPAITPAVRYTGSGAVGKVGLFGGYGLTGTGLTGAVGSIDGELRIGTNQIDAYFLGDETTAKVFLADFDNPANIFDSLLGSPFAHPFELQTAPGDSGGPVFVFAGNQFAVAGVNSFLLPLDLVGDADYGDISGATRVTKYNDWIDATLALSAEELAAMHTGPTASRPSRGNGLLRPAMAMAMPAVPEPLSLALMGTGLLGFGFRFARGRRSRPSPALAS